MARRHEKPDEWYNINRLMGMRNWKYQDGTPINNYMMAVLGDPDCGKSYSVTKWALNKKMKNPSGVKLYWMRLTDESCKKMLEDDGIKTFDPDLQRKFGLELKRQGKRLWQCKKVEREITKGKNKGEIETKFVKEYPIVEVIPLSTTYGMKGVQWYDYEYEGEYIVIFDEMNRESNERRTFDVVKHLARMLENLMRDNKKCKACVIMIGNNTSDASEVLSALNIFPTDFGVFKIKPRYGKGGRIVKKPGIIVDFIRPSASYAERREGSFMSTLVGNTVTKEFESDRVVKVERPKRAGMVINFSGIKFIWHTGHIIFNYRGESIGTQIAMRLHDKEGFYDSKTTSELIKMYGAKVFRFESKACQIAFETQMQLLKRG